MTRNAPRHDPASLEPAHPVRDGGAGLVRHLAADLRRPRRADRGHAAHAGRREAVDRPAPVPARHELLHAAARPGGAAAGHLRRLAAARHPRRARRRRPVRAARRRRPAGALGGLRRLRLHDRRGRAVRRARARRARDRRAGRGPGRRSGRSTSPALVAIAVASFLALALFAVPFPVVVLVAGSLGWALRRVAPGRVRTGRGRRPRTPARRRSSPTTSCTPSCPSTRRTAAGAADRAARLGGAGRRGRAADRHRQRVHPAGPLLLRRGGGHLRRRLRGARLRGPAGGRRSTAGWRRGRWCAAWPWPRRRPGR